MRQFNLYNGTVVVPTLARLVLFLAFFTTGVVKLFTTLDFHGEDAQRLIERGAGTTLPATDEQATPETNDLREALPEPPEEEILQDPVTGEEVLRAKRLYSVALHLIRAGVPDRWPVILAWAAALTEVIGATLLLVGLFSRVWALGLAIILGVAFYLTSWAPLLESNPFGIATDVNAFNRLYAQLGLLVLAIGVVLTGPGPLSLDRLLFRPNGGREPKTEVPEYDTVQPRPPSSERPPI